MHADPRGIGVSGQDVAALNIIRDPFHDEWNHGIPPHKPETNAVV